MALSHYTTSLRIRSYEIGRDGIVSAGTLLRYLEQIATEASAAAGFPRSWYDEHDSAWVVRQMTFELTRPLTLADDLFLDTWPAQYARVQAYREYIVSDEQKQHLLARAHAHWVYVNRQRGLPIRLPAEIPEQAIADPTLVQFSPPPTMTPPANTPVTFELPLVARFYEADIMGHINNTIYMDWLEEAIHAALEKLPAWHLFQASGEQPERRAFLQRGAIDYMKASIPGDHLLITSILQGRTEHGLVWSQTIQRMDSAELLVRADTFWSWLI
jgi:acyl-CoA thioester hydrolase